jgi:hypothetical protein
MNKGFVILAQNTEKTNYVKCADVLKNSLLRVMPDANVTIITELPYGDLAPNSDWKLINDWQVYEASPYEYTIKLEADMYCPVSIDYWWNILKHRDIVVSTCIRNYKGDISTSRAYRGFIDANNLPDVYNAITYFRKSDFAEKFFKTVRTIFENWEDFKLILQCDPKELATTDWVYALACHIHGIENTTLPFNAMSMVHMKPMINELKTDNWTNELIYEVNQDCLRISTFVQQHMFHYHIKEFANELDRV